MHRVILGCAAVCGFFYVRKQREAKKATVQWTPEMLSKYDSFVFDCDGVIYRGKNAVTGAADAVKRLQKLGKKVAFLTNGSAKSREDLQIRLNKLGVPAEIKQCVPSSFLAARLLQQHCDSHPGFFDKKSHRVFYIGGKGIGHELEKLGFQVVSASEMFGNTVYSDEDICNIPLDQSIRAIVCGIHTSNIYAIVGYALSLLADPQVVFIGTNRVDVNYPVYNNRNLPGGGSVIRMLECASGRPCLDAGKPAASIFTTVLQPRGFERGRTLMVGDRLDSDILFARNAGIDSCLVLSGCSGKESLAKKGSVRPTYWAQHIGDMFREG